MLELELDQDGSPVTIEPRGWFVCIVPGLQKQWWHRFVNARHKHVFAMCPARPSEWTLFEPWWHRLLSATMIGSMHVFMRRTRRSRSAAVTAGGANAHRPSPMREDR
jgi:hypothetical protein